MMQGRGRISIKIVSLLLLLGLCLYSCGGSDADPMTSTGTPTDPPANMPAKTLSWQPPTSYTDGTPINSETDIQSFEIYVKDTSSFDPKDVAMASVAHTDRSFNLALFYPDISQGVTYYVSIRVAMKSGAVSDFSTPVSFSL